MQPHNDSGAGSSVAIPYVDWWNHRHTDRSPRWLTAKAHREFARGWQCTGRGPYITLSWAAYQDWCRPDWHPQDYYTQTGG